MNGDSKYTKLLEPCQIGELKLKNRIVMAAMGLNYASEEGFVTQRQKDFYEERAKGGVGAIVLGVGLIDLVGKLITNQTCIYDDEFIPGLTELRRTIQRHGAGAIMQLQHGGRYSRPERNGGHQPVAPSAILQPGVLPGRETPRELTVEEIGQLVERFADGAERAKKAGFDGVEIHAGHGYLIAQFLSGYSNKRRDDYGGNLEDRSRFLLEIIRAVRDRVGEGYPVWCRIDGMEFGLENGITPDDGQELARMIAEAGVDAINVSGYGGDVGVNFTKAPLTYAPGSLVSLAEGVKKVVSVPVIAVGRISPELGEKVLRQGRADLIAMARPLIADPDLPNKLASGSLGDIRPCINCYTCIHQIFMSDSMYCAVNAAAGKEGQFKLDQLHNPKRVLVVGGGPSGMESARVAASRGHQVTLCEKTNRLGGSLFFASVLTKENEDLLDYLVRQVKKLPIDVKYNEEITPGLIEGINPDAAIVALGPSLTPPEIPGSDRRNVIAGADLRQMISGRLGKDAARRLGWWHRMVLALGRPILKGCKPSTLRRLSEFWMPIGKRVAIVGGDFVATELAEFLADRGRKVVVLGSGQQMAEELAIPSRWVLLDSLLKKGVTMVSEAKCEEITREGIVITNKNGAKQIIEADTVVFAEGIEPNPELFQAIQAKVAIAYAVGDCKGLGLIKGAIADGASIAAEI
jgi:2,4-dienoyl-CoA reductase-like NADH-dependent reductase (Old Yellow Enzyme family)